MISSADTEFRYFKNPVLLAESLAKEISNSIRKTVTRKGVCHMVFPGGKSPLLTLEMLREMDVPWELLHLYPSDERCVARGDPERNDRLIDELIFGHVPLPLENLHRIS
ncbi:MAG TPA: 6-phosphogluconolactonase, partial [Bacteroidaceae bacterium]|nr:6-phosphogluconolactonase [Bacteroidaceae bacterium]